MKIAIYGNKHQEAHIEALFRFFEALSSHPGLSVAMEYTFFNYLSRILPSQPHVDEVIHGDKFSAQFALSLGGDGTFLRTAQWVGSKNIPILGINTGHLGYLADTQIDEATDIIDGIINNQFKIEERSLIEVETDNESGPDWKFALIEVAILKQDTASMITVKAAIDDVDIASYKCDGLIIATPTGSTGYNLSVGGPIIEPCAPNWVISPIAAHSLTMRPLVVRNTGIITATTTSRASNYLLSLDGRSTTMQSGTTIKIRKAPFSIKVAQRPDHHFCDTLRDKLLWGIDKR